MALRTFFKFSSLTISTLKRQIRTPVRFNAFHKLSLPVFALSVAKCETTRFNFNWDDESLEHDFLIKQACTVNVNSASQLLTVTLVAIQDTSQKLRETLSQEISLVRQALEWGDRGTSEEHWERLIAVRGRIVDLKQNIQTLNTYYEYAERLATSAAEISYLSGNVTASDAICERLAHAGRVYRKEAEETHALQLESLDLQKVAITSSQQMEEMMKGEGTDNHNLQNSRS